MFQDRTGSKVQRDKLGYTVCKHAACRRTFEVDYERKVARQKTGGKVKF